MGNYTSCANLSLHFNKSATVILPGGQIQHFRHPIKAAHLMLDYPAYFLSNSHSLNIGTRFIPLPADQDLELGNLYVMLPMRKLNSIVTADDIMDVDNPQPQPQLGQESNENEKKENLGIMEYYKCSRVSRKPLLDTITEEPSFFIFLT